MRFLLDTHTVLWAASADPRLSAVAEAALGDPDNELFFSLCSAWEIAIKRSIGKLRLPISTRAFVGQLQTRGVALVGIHAEHLYDVETLPLHHRDPFDRLLIAQALSEGLSVLGADDQFDAYGIARVW